MRRNETSEADLHLKFFPRSVTLPSVHKSFVQLGAGTELEQRPTSALAGSLELRSGILIETRTRSDKRSLRYTLLDSRVELKKKVQARAHSTWPNTHSQAISTFRILFGPAHQTLNTFSSSSRRRRKRSGEKLSHFFYEMVRSSDNQSTCSTA